MNKSILVNHSADLGSDLRGFHIAHDHLANGCLADKRRGVDALVESLCDVVGVKSADLDVAVTDVDKWCLCGRCFVACDVTERQLAYLDIVANPHNGPALDAFYAAVPEDELIVAQRRGTLACVNVLNGNIVEVGACTRLEMMVGDKHRIVTVGAVNAADEDICGGASAAGKQTNTRITVSRADVADNDIGNVTAAALGVTFVDGSEGYHIVIGDARQVLDNAVVAIALEVNAVGGAEVAVVIEHDVADNKAVANTDLDAVAYRILYNELFKAEIVEIAEAQQLAREEIRIVDLVVKSVLRHFNGIVALGIAVTVPGTADDLDILILTAASEMLVLDKRTARHGCRDKLSTGCKHEACI